MVSRKKIDRTAPGDKAVRRMLSALLDWEDAHVGFEKAVAGVPPELRGVRPSGAPRSLWEIVEHLRLAQADILEFCVSSGYEEKKWPDDYWPAEPSPSSRGDWDASIAAFLRDRRSLQKLAADPKIDLSEKIPHGSGQTYLRELVLVADHTAYHVGQLVLVRRLLGIWKA
jgi:DinB superfamily